MSDPVLQFLGAAGTVTGSRFLVESGGSRVLVDAGMFQGLKQHRLMNWQRFPVDPSSIDAVALTHAHIDHSGFLPALVREGYSGPVYCTRRTMDLCGILLPDAAHLQEEEARYANEKGFSKHHPALPLFTADDAAAALDLLWPVDFGVSHQIADEIAASFVPAGHILGSASVLLEMGTAHRRRSVLVSGDLGRGNHPLLVEPGPAPAADVVLIETTYGDRAHPDPNAEVAALAEVISDSAARGGIILIPAFAVDRTEVVLLLLRDLVSEGLIPKLPIYADSPMALKVLDVYRQAVEDGDLDVRVLDAPPPFAAGDDVHECRTTNESKALAELTYPSIIISASGMATGGRVLHHLARLLPDDRNAVVMSGFQAAGTRGRTLVEGARSVKMLGRHVPVRATVLGMESLSVHADADELVAWLSSMPEAPEIVYAVHGESNASEAMCARLESDLDLLAVVPHQGERVVVS